mmetsp:Transcript_38077/g.89157  ORF Transcript_38077/g.89157 Transcript_38077/m.89157 type:complete len:343 (+) Transcript_38077:318-1346(+)
MPMASVPLSTVTLSWWRSKWWASRIASWVTFMYAWRSTVKGGTGLKWRHGHTSRRPPMRHWWQRRTSLSLRAHRRPRGPSIWPRRWRPPHGWRRSGTIHERGRWHHWRRRPELRKSLSKAFALAFRHRLLGNLLVESAKLVSPHLDGFGHILYLIGLVVDNHVQSWVFVDLAVGLHVAPCQHRFSQARLLLDLGHAFAFRAQEQADHVRAIHVATAIDAPLGFGESNRDGAFLLLKHLPAARYGPCRGAIKLMLRHHCVVVAVEDHVRHALRSLLSSEHEDLLDICGAEAVQVLPKVSLSACFRQAFDENLEVCRQAILMLWPKVRSERHVAFIDIDLLAHP